MTRSFNLVDHPFIPCIRTDGSFVELGLRDVLALAHDIREFRDDSPLVTISLHRLLLAILHRNFGPPSLKAWKMIWSAGHFDSGKLDGYFTKWHDRFDLCHPKYPFYQNARQVEGEEAPITWIIPSLGCGDHATLFDHTSHCETPSLSPAAAARYVISLHNFHVGGFGPGRSIMKATPNLTNLLTILMGDSLFETLCLNLTVYPNDQLMPKVGDDRPGWEADEHNPIGVAETIPTGYLDYLTWQSRSVRLIPVCDDKLAFGSVQMEGGRRMAGQEAIFDPMVSYIRDDATAGYLPIKLREGRATWRDSHPLLNSLTANSKAPAVVAQAAVLRGPKFDAFPGRGEFKLATFGTRTEKGKAAKLLFWRHETLPLPLSYLEDEQILSHLAAALKATEDAATALWSSLRRLGEIASTSDQGGNPDKKRVTNFVAGLGHDTKYWSQLETPFRRLLMDLPGDAAHQEEQLVAWKEWVCDVARGVFNQIIAGLDPSPRILKAVYSGQWGGQKKLDVELSKIKQPISNSQRSPS